MIDSKLRDRYQKYLINPLLRNKWIQKMHPNALSWAGLLTGLASLPFIAMGYVVPSIFLLFLSGFLDTLDGSLARFHNKISKHGAVLDIFFDRIIESGVILALFLNDQYPRALPSMAMLVSVLLCITSFLVVGIFETNSSEKSFHYSPGLIERAEAFIFFTAMILFPAWFAELAFAFAFLVLLTALIRISEFTSQAKQSS